MADPLPRVDDARLERALCVVAHPDDVEYGAAGVVARWTARRASVSYVLATRGEAGIDGMAPDDAGPVREREQRAAAAAVGVDDVEFLDHRDGVVEYGLALRRDLARAIRRHRPEIVLGVTGRTRFVGGGTNFADHRAVALAVLDAARDAANRWVFPELVDAGLEPWSGLRQVLFVGSPEPTHGIDVTGHLDASLVSLAAHATYLAALGEGAAAAATGQLRVAAASAARRLGGDREGVEYGVLVEAFGV